MTQRSIGFRFIILAALISAAPASAASGRTSMPEAEPPTRGLYLQLIRQARADGRPRAAIAYLDDFDRQFPGDLDARLLRINSLLDLGQNDKADAVLSALGKTAANGRNAAAINAAHGHVLAAHGAWGEAASRYEAAVAADPTDPMLRNALGYALIRTGAYDRAIEALRGATDLAPGDTIVRNNLVLALTLGGQPAALADAIAQAGDRRAQADLRRQSRAEADRLISLKAGSTQTLASVAIANAAGPSTRKDR
jgi:Flp pilus assembly protein TadD